MGATQKTSCRATLRAGQIVWDEYGLSCPRWEEAGDYKTL